MCKKNFFEQLMKRTAMKSVQYRIETNHKTFHRTSRSKKSSGKIFLINFNFLFHRNGKINIYSNNKPDIWHLIRNFIQFYFYKILICFVICFRFQWKVTMLLPLHTVHILWRMKLSFCQHLHFMKTLQNNKKVINRFRTLNIFSGLSSWHRMCRYTWVMRLYCPKNWAMRLYCTFD